ncbi:MAG TPA: alanine racemase [Thermomicrobiales bacterium]|jgi:D-serine deaminase-like pyridoxal phosphate-dependent protein
MTATFAPPSHTIVAPTELIDTPTMVVDEAILHTNIAEMAALAKSLGVALRPHIKTHKTPQIARLQLAAGAIGVTCAKLGEAEVMAEAGVEDILIAYPIVGDLKIRRLLALMERVRMIVALDSHEAAEAISQAMAAEDRTLDVYVEVNTGQNRAGARYGEEAVALALNLARLPGLRVVGVFTHEGHANAQPPETIEPVALEAGRNLVATAEAIRSHGLELPVVSVGSTPAATYTPTVPGVTEMRPGTYVFKDTSAFRYGIFGPDRCAARILATVVSHPAPDRCILDGGSKTLSLDKTPSHPGHGYIVGHEDAIIDRMSEEHGVVILPPDEPGFRIGERVEVIPNHICPTVNLMDQLTIVRDGHVADVWPVAARGKIR